MLMLKTELNLLDRSFEFKSHSPHKICRSGNDMFKLQK